MSEDPISGFRGDYFFLSNFYESPLIYKGQTYRCAEAAFQAQKDFNCSYLFANLNGKEAKAMGRRVRLHQDWNDVRIEIMYEVLLAKFESLPLRKLLLKTGNRKLIETNTWWDTYWGVCNGEGENNLGELLMEIREKIRKDQEKLMEVLK